MIIVLVGETSCGKSYYLKRILDEMPQLSKAVEHTTRPMRIEEEQGLNYTFVSDWQMYCLLQNDEMISYAHYDTIHGIWCYGLHKEAFKDETKDYICVLDYSGWIKVKQLYPDAIGFMIHRDYNECKASYLARGGDIKEFERRCSDDNEKFKLAQSDADLYHVVNVVERTDEIVKMMKCIIGSSIK